MKSSNAGALGAAGIKISCDIKHKALAPELMSKVEVKKPVSVVALYNCFFQHSVHIFVLNIWKG